MRRVEGAVGEHGVSVRDVSFDIVEFESGVAGQNRFRILTQLRTRTFWSSWRRNCNKREIACFRQVDATVAAA